MYDVFTTRVQRVYNACKTMGELTFLRKGGFNSVYLYELNGKLSIYKDICGKNYCTLENVKCISNILSYLDLSSRVIIPSISEFPPNNLGLSGECSKEDYGGVSFSYFVGNI